jgi:hypothetical protein
VSVADVFAGAVAADADLPLTRDPFAAEQPFGTLLGAVDSAWLRERWREVERASGVEPQRALTGADELARQMLERLARAAAAERDAHGGSSADLWRYRVLFERVLAA